MEEFGYKESWKFHKFMEAGYPVLGLIAILVYWAVLVAPSRESTSGFEFEWWVLLFAFGLVVWAIFEIRSTLAVYRFKVRLSDDAIEAGTERVPWADVIGVEFKQALGASPAAIIRASDGRVLNVPAAIESYDYIKRVIEGRTANKVPG
jgi:hypothetical protein